MRVWSWRFEGKKRWRISWYCRVCTECGWFWWSCLFLCLEAFSAIIICWNMDFSSFCCCCMCGLMIITQKLIWFYIPHKRPHTKEKSQHEMFPWWHTAACTFRLYVMHIMLDRRDIPIYLGKSANMTWHKMMHYQNKLFSFKNLLYKVLMSIKHLVLTRDAFMHSRETMKSSRGRTEGLSLLLTVQACQWDKRCALQKQ